MNQSYPISFSKKNEYASNDYRFIDVCIDVMHTGENLNLSAFTKEAITAAIPSICNTPILGYVVDNDDDTTKDFKGHEHELKVTEDSVKYVYAGQAYGVIPESCNPRWVIKDDGTGTEREYLRVDALLWTKFGDPVDIFSRDVTKGHSVELTDMVCVPRKDSPIVDVSSFKFDGCCILSTTDPQIKPAMTGSCITACFTSEQINDIGEQVKARLFEYEALRSNAANDSDNNSKEKGDTEPMEINEMNTELEATASVVEDVIESEVVDSNAEMNVEPVAVETPIVVAVPTVEAIPAVEPPVQPAVVEPEPVHDEPVQLSLGQIMELINNELDKDMIPVPWDSEHMVQHYWLEDVQGNEVIARDRCDYALYGFNFEIKDGVVVIDYENKKRKKIVYADWDDNSITSNLTAEFAEIVDVATNAVQREKELNMNYSQIKVKYDEYVQAEADAKAAEMTEKRNALFAAMDEKLGNDAEYEALKENQDIEYSELETKCYTLLGRKSANFSYVPTQAAQKNVRFGVGGSQTNSEGAYGGLIERYRANN